MKKRIIFVVLTLSLLLCAGVASAENASGFQGIAWLTNYTDTVAAIPGTWFITSVEPSYSIEHLMYNQNDYVYDADIAFTAFYDPDAIDMNVDGYDVMSLILQFVLLTDEQGLLPGDEQSTGLYYAEYRLKSDDPAAAYDELVNKYTGLYGEAGNFVTEAENQTTTYSVWYSALDTMFSIRKEEYADGSGSLCLQYGYANANEYLQEAVWGCELELRMEEQAALEEQEADMGY